MLDRPNSDAWADRQIQDALKVLSDHHAREWEAARAERERVIRKNMASWLAHAEGCKARALDYAQWSEDYDEGDPRRHKYRAESIHQQRMYVHAMQQYRREEAKL